MSGIDGLPHNEAAIPPALITDTITANDEFKLTAKYRLPITKPTGVDQTIVSTGAIGSGGETLCEWKDTGTIGEEYTTVVWKPGVASSGIQFATWAEVKAEVEKVAGACLVWVDDSVAPAIVNSTLNCQGRAFFRGTNDATLTIATGGVLINPHGFHGWLTVSCANTLAPSIGVSDGHTIHLTDGVILRADEPAVIPIIVADGHSINFLMQDAKLEHAANYVVSAGPGSNINLYIRDNLRYPVWNGNPIFFDRAPTAALHLYRDASYPENVVVGWGGTINSSDRDKAVHTFYDDINTPQFGVSTVQGALNVLKSRVDQNVNTTSNPTFQYPSASEFRLTNGFIFANNGVGEAKLALIGQSPTIELADGYTNLIGDVYIGQAPAMYKLPTTPVGSSFGDTLIFNDFTNEFSFGKDNTKADKVGSADLSITKSLPVLEFKDTASGPGFANATIRWRDAVGANHASIDADGPLTIKFLGTPRIAATNVGAEVFGTLKMASDPAGFYTFPANANGVADGSNLRLNAATRQMYWGLDGGGNVVGPGSSVSGRVALWDSADGKLLRNSALQVDSLGRMRATMGFTYPSGVPYTIFRSTSQFTQTSNTPVNFFGGTPAFNTAWPVGVMRTGDVLRYTVRGQITVANNRAYTMRILLYNADYTITSAEFPAYTGAEFEFVHSITVGADVTTQHLSHTKWQAGATFSYSNNVRTINFNASIVLPDLLGAFQLADPTASMTTREILMEYLPRSGV